MQSIITYPDIRLTEKSEPVAAIKGGIREHAETLVESLARHKAPGIALSQFGVMKRVIALKGGGNGAPLVIVNPEIRKSAGSVTEGEGCLSLPDVWLDIARPRAVTVAGFGLNGAEIIYEAAGYAARAAAHEIDHLDGILIWDHLPAKARQRAIASFLSGCRSRAL